MYLVTSARYKERELSAEGGCATHVKFIADFRMGTGSAHRKVQRSTLNALVPDTRGAEPANVRLG